jgi:hypothetical protein
LISLNTPDDPIVDEIGPRTIGFLIVDMTKTVADLIILLLCWRGLLAFVAYLLRPFRSSALFLIESLSTRFLYLIRPDLLALLSRPLLALLATLLLTALLATTALLSRLRIGLKPPALLLGCSPLLLYSLALASLSLILITGHDGLLWLMERTA